MPLSALVAALLPVVPDDTEDAALRTAIVDLAQRRSYSAAEGVHAVVLHILERSNRSCPRRTAKQMLRLHVHQAQQDMVH